MLVWSRSGRGLGSGTKNTAVEIAKTINFLSLKRTMITIMRRESDMITITTLTFGWLSVTKIQMKNICDALSEKGLWAQVSMLPILIRQTQTLIRLIVSSTRVWIHYLTRPLLFLTRHLVIYVRHIGAYTDANQGC